MGPRKVATRPGGKGPEHAAFDDQKYSAVDCLSFLVMEKMQIREALAIDDDFTHRFIARPWRGARWGG